jgi:sugar/nucleoside kinase (ribokinase family)
VFQAFCPTPIVVRAGADGAYARAPEWQGWVPAFHNSSTGGARDVTGGGNAFMGGLLAGMLLTGDVRAGESPLHIQISRSVHLRLDGRVVCHRATRHSTALKRRRARAVE